MQLISPVFKKMPVSHKIAYISVMAALSVIVNMYSVDIAGGLIKLSFVGVVCVISGALFGPVFGFAIGFLGDFISFLVIASGYAYSPLIGVSNGMYAAIAGLVFIFFKNRGLLIKVLISSISAYFVCTLLITSLGIFILFGSKYTFWIYILRRIIFQTPVTIINAIVMYLLLKSMSSVKFFKFSVS
jgi:ECF transporter S component (folate family)